MKRYGDEDKMIAGAGIFRCCPMLPIVREAKDGRNRMAQRMKEAMA